jgi:hypothetical protein
MGRLLLDVQKHKLSLSGALTERVESTAGLLTCGKNSRQFARGNEVIRV